MERLIRRAESPVRQLFAVSGHEDRRKGGDLFPAAVAVEHSGGVQAAVHSALHIVPAVAHHQHPLALHDGLGEDVADDVGLVVAALIHGRAAHEGEVRRKGVKIKKASVSGYQIKYASNKNFKKAKTRNTRKTIYTIKSLRSKKKCYVKVRAYKVVKGKKIYGSYSKVLKVTVK